MSLLLMGIKMSHSDVEHFANMIDGCENLSLGDKTSPNSVYTITVLNLHKDDGISIEGFEAQWRAGFFKSAKAWLTTPLQMTAGLTDVSKELNAKLRPIANSIFSTPLQSVMDTFKGEDRSIMSKANDLLNSLHSENWTQVIFINSVVSLIKSMHKEIKGNVDRLEKLKDKNPEHKKLGKLAETVSKQMKTSDAIYNCIPKYSSKADGVIRSTINSKR